jgi:hypothetical protein
MWAWADRRCGVNMTGQERINLTLRRVRVISVAVECVLLSLSYPARKAHALYYTVICGLSGSAIFFHIIS